MKILVIYYSQTGRTKRVAKELTDILGSRGAEVKQARIEPEEERDYNTNITEARKGVAAKVKLTLTDVSVYDLLCMGTPVWSSAPAPSVNGYLATCSGLEGKKAACFATYGGGSARSTLEKLRAKLEEKGAKVIGSLGIDSTRLFNDKVKDSIRDFAKKLC